MKRKQVTLAVLLAALAFLAAPSASAISPQEVQAIKNAVANVPAAELAAKAAQIVREAAAKDRQDTAVTAVREIVSKRPATVLAVVAAISKAAPEVSPAVAAEAAKLVSDQAAEIAKIATISAPSQSERIAAAVAKVSPKSAVSVTRNVAAVVPGQTAKIVESVVASVPSAKNQLTQDATLTRLSQRSADETATSGVIVSIPGTIRGTPPPNTPPLEVGAPVAGADESRKYGNPD